MFSLKLAFLGGGHMTEAIVAGLVSHGYDAKLLYVIDRNAHKCEQLINTYHIHAHTTDKDILSYVDVIFIAIKPQDAKAACHTLEKHLQNQSPLVISVMAGITTHLLHQWLGKHLAMIRAAPNTPALIQSGATGLFANSHVSATQKTYAEKLLSAVGHVVWLTDESHMDAVTALSGSGPAYYFYFMACMQDAAIEMGLPHDIARQLTLQTAYGAAKLAMQSDKSFDALRAQVTSKGGTTEAALKHMMQHDLSDILANALKAAQQRSLALSQAADDSGMQ